MITVTDFINSAPPIIQKSFAACQTAPEGLKRAKARKIFVDAMTRQLAAENPCSLESQIKAANAPRFNRTPYL